MQVQLSKRIVSPFSSSYDSDWTTINWLYNLLVDLIQCAPIGDDNLYVENRDMLVKNMLAHVLTILDDESWECTAAGDTYGLLLEEIEKVVNTFVKGEQMLCSAHFDRNNHLNKIIRLLYSTYVAVQDQESVKGLVHDFEQSNRFLHSMTNFNHSMMIHLLNECSLPSDLVEESRMACTFFSSETL
jgi:hypothetical protein